MSIGRKDGSAQATPTELLAGVPLFSGMGDDELARVAALSSTVEVEPGAVLVDQGDPGTYCYVVVSGTAGVYVNGEYVASSAPGATIGEMALIDHRPRTATVVASEPMTLLRFDTKAFSALLSEMPKAAERVHALLGARLSR